MLKITIKGGEFWDQEKEEFFYPDEFVLELEHSLVSLSKWEQNLQKPFISSDKSDEEALFYVECMVLDPNLPPEVLSKLTQQNMDEISDYIMNKMTATFFSDEPSGVSSSQLITSELIYSWMVTYEVDFQTQYWHLNRLLTLIKVLDRQRSQSSKKTNTADIGRRQRELNAIRRKKYNTPG